MVHSFISVFMSSESCSFMWNVFIFLILLWGESPSYIESVFLTLWSFLLSPFSRRRVYLNKVVLLKRRLLSALNLSEILRSNAYLLSLMELPMGRHILWHVCEANYSNSVGCLLATLWLWQYFTTLLINVPKLGGSFRSFTLCTGGWWYFLTIPTNLLEQ